MSRASLVMALSCTLLLAPCAAAQECTSDCEQQSLLPMLNHEQVESVQIELLERGIVPVVLRGNHPQRMAIATRAIDRLISYNDR